ncbi:MAG: ATPase [Actinobacteria bacterium]|nr:ATPase [Actinomycetota bacterium]
MTITSVTKDPVALTMAVVADFPVPLERLWNAYMDPRQLERFWGPEVYPAKFTQHDAFVGGFTHYVMTGPDGDQSRGYWEWLELEPLKSFTVLDGFSNADGTPNTDLPSMRLTFEFEATDTGSRFTNTSFFNSLEEFETVIEMGVEEGMRSAMSQIDGVLADLARFAAGREAELELVDTLKVRVSRIIRGTVEQVWRAHHEPELLQRWLLGPDGWTMPVCEVATRIGDPYRYEWQEVDGPGRFGFTGELLESHSPRREVTTERMIDIDGTGTPGATTRNELTLTEVDGGTLLAVVITYPSAEIRDIVLATGMVDGMEASYARMEATVLGA